MQIQIPPDEVQVVKSLAIDAGFTSIDQYVLDLIERDKERAAIQVGLDQARRGKCVPLTSLMPTSGNGKEFRPRAKCLRSSSPPLPKPT